MNIQKNKGSNSKILPSRNRAFKEIENPKGKRRKIDEDRIKNQTLSSRELLSDDYINNFEQCEQDQLLNKLKFIVLNLESLKITANKLSDEGASEDLSGKVAKLEEQKNEIYIAYQIAYERQLIQNLEKDIKINAEKLVKQKLNGFAYRSCDNFRFSEDFNKSLFIVYAEELPEKEKEIAANNTVYKQFYKDINRSKIVLIDENGREEDFVSNYPIDNQLQKQWKDDKIARLLEFANKDKIKLLKLSQCLCQTMGNGYFFLLEKKQVEDSPQQLENAPQFVNGKLFKISSNDNPNSNEYFEVKKAKNGNIIIKYVAEFKNFGYIIYQKEPMQIVSKNSYYRLNTGIILDSANEWKQFDEGGVQYLLKVSRSK